MSLLISWLYLAAITHKSELGLNSLELQKSRIEQQVSGISVLFGGISIVLATTVPDYLATLAGYIYFVLIPFLYLPHYIHNKRFGSD